MINQIRINGICYLVMIVTLPRPLRYTYALFPCPRRAMTYHHPLDFLSLGGNKPSVPFCQNKIMLRNNVLIKSPLLVNNC